MRVSIILYAAAAEPHCVVLCRVKCTFSNTRQFPATSINLEVITAFHDVFGYSVVLSTMRRPFSKYGENFCEISMTTTTIRG